MLALNNNHSFTPIRLENSNDAIQRLKYLKKTAKKCAKNVHIFLLLIKISFL